MISKLCYELYKIGWKQYHIDVERERKSIKDYYEFLMKEEDEDVNVFTYTYNDYLEEFGYDGELYVCYEEFCETEYLEEDYIRVLLNDESLLKMYYEDIKQEV
jgi:hypothetical protein